MLGHAAIFPTPFPSHRPMFQHVQPQVIRAPLFRIAQPGTKALAGRDATALRALCERFPPMLGDPEQRRPNHLGLDVLKHRSVGRKRSWKDSGVSKHGALDIHLSNSSLLTPNDASAVIDRRYRRDPSTSTSAVWWGQRGRSPSLRARLRRGGRARAPSLRARLRRGGRGPSLRARLQRGGRA